MTSELNLQMKRLGYMYDSKNGQSSILIHLLAN
jgi:hypothetical protein